MFNPLFFVQWGLKGASLTSIEGEVKSSDKMLSTRKNNVSWLVGFYGISTFVFI